MQFRVLSGLGLGSRVGCGSSVRVTMEPTGAGPQASAMDLASGRGRQLGLSEKLNLAGSKDSYLKAFGPKDILYKAFGLL